MNLPIHSRQTHDHPINEPEIDPHLKKVQRVSVSVYFFHRTASLKLVIRSATSDRSDVSETPSQLLANFLKLIIDPESGNHQGGLGDEWAAVGTCAGAPELTYDEDLGLPSDIITNTWSVPEMQSDPSGSRATADITNDTSEGKGDPLPPSYEYTDVYLDV
jgi:hypothetical protein